MTKPPLASVLALALCLPSLVQPRPAAAQEPAAEAARAEARDRFDRGLRLFNEGDSAGALAEFKRAYELVPSPVVLYNVALAYASMNRPVDAVDALSRLLASPGSLAPERVERARATLAEQKARIAELTVKVSVDGAVIEVDGVEAGKSPLAAPLRVGGGSHIVGAVAPAYSPARKEVTLAGLTRGEVSLELVPMTGRLSHLSVKTHLPAAELVIDDQPVARTPLSASLTLSPGPHRVELRRAGYVTAREQITLGEGASGEIALDPAEDPAAADRGDLSLFASETQPVVIVDGKPRGVYVGPVALPGGLHRLRVERGGFQAFERDIVIEPGHAITITALLEPTPETRAAYVSSASARRRWSWVTIVAGAAVATTGGVLLGVNAPKRSAAQATLDAQTANAVRGGGGTCDPMQTSQIDLCLSNLDAAQAAVNAAHSRDLIGFAALGVGAAAIGAGLVLLLTGDDPARYDRRPSSETLGRGLLQPSMWAGPRAGGLSLAGSF